MKNADIRRNVISFDCTRSSSSVFKSSGSERIFFFVFLCAYQLFFSSFVAEYRAISEKKMANERKSIRKSVDARFKLYFNKGCECGKFLNEHLLPDDVGATSLSDVFIACIEKLFCANIHTDSTRFANALIRKIGKYYEIQVRNPLHLRNLLKQVCEVFDACSNLISSKQLNACRFCDGDNEKEEPKAKKVKLVLAFYRNLFFFGARIFTEK